MLPRVNQPATSVVLRYLKIIIIIIALNGLLPVEQVPVTSSDVRLDRLIDSGDHADAPRELYNYLTN